MGILERRRIELREEGHPVAVAQAELVRVDGRLETQLVVCLKQVEQDVLHTRFWVGENLRGALNHASQWVLARRSLR